MNAALNVSMIVIGDEILNGRTTDLNGSFLSKYLFKKGLHFKSLRFIHDDIEEMNRALTDSMNESDIVITSGGIGPTVDDKTKNTLASFFGKKIIERDDVAAVVTKNYEQFGRSWTKSHNHYHFFPEDFIPTNNPRGLAPGITYFDKEKKKLILSGPGVPREFTEMVDKEFFPIISKHFSGRLMEFHQTVIRTIEVPEEKIFFELCPTLWDDLEKFGKVSSLPHTIGIDIVVGYTGDKKLHEKKSAEIKALIETTPLKDKVWQYGNIPVGELVFNKALEKKTTVSLAESCTGGLMASKITDLAGSSAFFMGSAVTYSNESKTELLGVNPETIKAHGAVSPQVAEEMAAGSLKKFKSDYAVSLTGIAGPDGGTPEKPVGTVVIGYASKNVVGSKTYVLPGDRKRKKDRFSDTALLILLQLMEGKLD